MSAVTEVLPYSSEYEVPLQKEVKPFAFDLSREYERAQQLGERGLPFFIANASYYAKETHGRVRIDEYEHRIKRDEDGNVTLVFGPDDQIARDSYKKPTEDPRIPKWYQDRAWADVKWTHMMEEELAKAKPGDRFLDLSPTEFDISYDERKKWNYGKHSFACVSELVVEDGKEKLVTRPLRHYLDFPEQRLLYAFTTGEDIEPQDLLRNVGKLREDLHIGHVEKTVEGLYDNTPLDRKIIPDSDDAIAKSVEEMQEILAPFENWLRGIYRAMQQGYSPLYIQEQFRGWENVLKASIAGEHVDTEYFKNMDPDSILYAYHYGGAVQIQEYTDREYIVEDSSCGAGAGFSNVERQDSPMTYENMTKEKRAEDDPRLCRCKRQSPHFHCPGKTKEGKDCKHEIIVGKGITKCPNCGEGKKC